MTGCNVHEKVDTNYDMTVCEVVAVLLGITRKNVEQENNIEYQGRLIDPRRTVRETGIQEQEFIMIHPKLKGGAGGEQELVIAQTKIKEQKE